MNATQQVIDFVTKVVKDMGLALRGAGRNQPGRDAHQPRG